MASQARDDEKQRAEGAAQSSSATGSAPTPPPKKELYPMVNWKYDLFLYIVGNLVDLFFREVVPRGSWRVPTSGPVLFVAAPHANQVRILFLGGVYFFFLYHIIVTCHALTSLPPAKTSPHIG